MYFYKKLNAYDSPTVLMTTYKADDHNKLGKKKKKLREIYINEDTIYESWEQA